MNVITDKIGKEKQRLINYIIKQIYRISIKKLYDIIDTMNKTNN